MNFNSIIYLRIKAYGSFNPSKGFWWISTRLRTRGGRWTIMFQSLKGILVNFNRAQPHLCVLGGAWCFNPSKGFWWISTSSEQCRRGSVIVSIPQRDFGEFQPSRWRRFRLNPFVFQSLKGILVNFNSSPVLLSGAAELFQSLKGILVNFNDSGLIKDIHRFPFQSLKGILVNFNFIKLNRKN